MEIFIMLFIGGMLVYWIGYFLGFQYGKIKGEENSSEVFSILNDDATKKHVEEFVEGFSKPDEALEDECLTTLYFRPKKKADNERTE